MPRGMREPIAAIHLGGDKTGGGVTATCSRGGVVLTNVPSLPVFPVEKKAALTSLTSI